MRSEPEFGSPSFWCEGAKRDVGYHVEGTLRRRLVKCLLAIEKDRGMSWGTDSRMMKDNVFVDWLTESISFRQCVVTSYECPNRI